MVIELGKFIQQSAGYKAFIPHPFQPKAVIEFPRKTHELHSHALLTLGKLDGITQLLPDLDFFIFMYIRKEATVSSQIEGTRATMIDAIAAESTKDPDVPEDVSDILHYIKAMNYGMKRLKTLPLSSRFLCEVHKILMKGARSSQFSDPEEFRKTQNWIGGASPNTASFVPPPPHEMRGALDDLEKFIHSKESFHPLIQTALIHAQFETIHPFLDGNGRTGRLLITFYLCQQNFIERPVLYLSTFFKQHQKIYYDLLHGYHHGDVVPWVNFFLEGIEQVANEAIKTSHTITKLRVKDLEKLQALGKTSSVSSLKVLHRLYKLPIVNASGMQKWTGFSLPGAQKVIDRFIDLGILHPVDTKAKYDRHYAYEEYLNIFS